MWTLGALTEAANKLGIRVGLSQVRRIRLLMGPGGGRSGRGRFERPGLCPKRTAVVDLYTRTPTDTTVVCVDELGPLISRAYPAHRAGPPTGTGSRKKSPTGVNWRRPGCTAGCGSVTGMR